VLLLSLATVTGRVRYLVNGQWVDVAWTVLLVFGISFVIVWLFHGQRCGGDS
jgi:hypothetical protein